MKINEIFEKYNSNKNGLSDKIAIENVKYGRNILKKYKTDGFFVKFFKQFQNLMVLVLLISAVVSTIVSIVTGEYEDLFEVHSSLLLLLQTHLLVLFKSARLIVALVSLSIVPVVEVCKYFSNHKIKFKFFHKKHSNFVQPLLKKQ